MNLFHKLFSSPSAMLKLAIGLCYLALGLYILLNANLLYFIDRTYRPILAVVFIAYGAFRLYRAVNDLRNE